MAIWLLFRDGSEVWLGLELAWITNRMVRKCLRITLRLIIRTLQSVEPFIVTDTCPILLVNAAVSAELLRLFPPIVAVLAPVFVVHLHFFRFSSAAAAFPTFIHHLLLVNSRFASCVIGAITHFKVCPFDGQPLVDHFRAYHLHSFMLSHSTAVAR